MAIAKGKFFVGMAAAGAAVWMWNKRAEPALVERTRQRLRPRRVGDAAATAAAWRAS
jgi:hypothetical protein